MTLDEFTHIIEVQGSDLASWPAESREPATILLASNEAAQALLEQHQSLDTALNQLDAPEFPALEARILNQSLPQRKRALIDSFVSWLLPEAGLANWWRPAMAACLPLVFGVLVGNYFSFGYTVDDDGFQYWEDELTLLSLADYSDDQL